MKKKIVAIVVPVVAVLVIGVLVGLYFYHNRFIYNKEGDVGNTTGNLYNGGMFCVYDGFVYFANPDDNGKIYRMKEDGSELKLISTDSGTHINICNGYMYYVKDNMVGDVAFISQEMLHGISRLKLGEDKAEVLHAGLSDALLLCGNDLYFRAYNKSTGAYYIRRAGIDGKTDESFIEDPCMLLDYNDNKIYYANTVGNHNLMFYNTKDNRTSECYAGNFYMPDCEDGYIYYIDLDNNHKISRISLDTLETEAISEDYAISYNVNVRAGEIYYQAENDVDDHRLCRMKLDGSDAETVMAGDYTNINFTEDYVYFYSLNSSSYSLYRAKLPAGRPDVFRPGKEKTKKDKE